jgi:putative membrane protein
MKRAAIWTLSLAIALGLPLAGQAQSTRGDAAKTDGSKSRTMSASDQRFMKKAAGGGKAEVELGRLASERGSSDAVKQFGQRMVTDHGKANDELAQLAQAKSVTLSTELDASHRRLVDRLSKLSGAEFDRAYMREMQKDHDTDVKEFQTEAKRAHDADVRSWAAKTLPVLQEHQQQAHQLRASLSTGRRASRGSSSSDSPSASGSSQPAGSTK